MSPDDFKRLVATGMTTDQIAIVMEMMDRDARAYAEAEEARKAKGRDRVAKWRLAVGLTSGEWLDLRLSIFARDNYTCVYCGASPGISLLHADHVLPVSRGGDSSPKNLVTACQSCNCAKRDRTPEEWLS